MNSYGDGRWGTGYRPLQTGPEQSAWDAGAAERRHQENMQRQRERHRDEDHRRMLEEQKRRRENLASTRTTSTPAPPDKNPGEAFNGLMMLTGIGGFTFLLVFVWNSIAAQFTATNGFTGAILNYGAWIVGAVGVGVGFRFAQTFMRLAKIILALAALFIAAGVAYGIYQGASN